MEIVLTFLLGIYVVPMLVVASRDHPQWPSVAAANLAFGWTGFGWIAALLWAMQELPPPPPSRASRPLRIVSGGRDDEAVPDETTQAKPDAPPPLALVRSRADAAQRSERAD